MDVVKGLKPPEKLIINFKPSAKQYELWKLLQPNCCNICGGTIEQREVGVNEFGGKEYKATCVSCGNQNLPQLILAGGAAGGGKCLSVNSSVCTPFGFRALKDLKVGDIISNPMTGGQQRIIYIHPKGKFKFYRVHFIDGTSTECSEGHLWRAHQSRNKSKKAKLNPEHYAEFGDDRIWETSAMFEWYQRKRQGMYAGTHLIIPLTKPVEFANSAKLPIDPYILGALIGDGCISKSVLSRGVVLMTTMDSEIKARFEKAGYDMSCGFQKENNRATNYHIKNQKLIDDLNKLGIAGNKSGTHVIPRRYMVTSIANRLELMKGLIDTDGYVDSRGHITYTTISQQLAEDVAWIVRSLGGVATITRNKAGYKDNAGNYIQCNDAWDVQIRLKLAPEICGLNRKKERARAEFNGGTSELGKRIVDIEYIGKQESFCITVDDPSGLYIADNFTVTHNSYLSSCWIISSCIRFPGLRAVVARKTLKSLKESILNTIKKVLREWGLKEDVNYKINNLENTITLWNTSVILMKELSYMPSDSSYSRLGSSEFAICAIEECNECEEKGVEVLLSRLRWMPECFKMPKMLLTCNPCLGWVRDRFVKDADGNPAKLREGEFYQPFTLDANPDEEFRRTYNAALERISDPATRYRLKYGNWDFVETNESAAYWNFKGEKHLVDGLKEKVYDPLKPIIISWDFNVAPFMSTLVFQADYENKKLYVLEEILGRPEDKENNTPALAEKISKKYLEERHMGGILITGDPAGMARSTQTADGVNNYSIILDRLHPTFRATRKVFAKQPPHKTRLDFINGVLAGESDWEILVDMRCRRLTEDLIYQKKTQTGEKDKSKISDPKLGIKYEKYGHLSDAFDYAVCLLLDKDWSRFQNGGRITSVTTVNAPIYGEFDY